MVSASEGGVDEDNLRYFKSPPSNIFKKMTFRSRIPSENHPKQSS